MKLKDIPNYLGGVKITTINWSPDEYIYFNGIVWVDEDENELGPHLFEALKTDIWELWQEPVKKVQWFQVLHKIKGHSAQVAENCYIDEKDFLENGACPDTEWYQLIPIGEPR